MTVATTLRAWSATAANNSPKGTDVIGTSADDELRQIQATIRQYLASQSATVVPSAGVADLTTATGHWVPISGSSTLTGLGSEDAGIEYVVTFTGAPTLVHSTALQLPGQATLTADTGMYGVAESLGSGNWRLWGLSHYDRPPARESVLMTEQASTSGTSIDFTSIPTWVTKIRVMLVGVSTSGSSNLLLQTGDSGGIETTGYLSGASEQADAGTNATATSTAGLILSANSQASSVRHIVVDLTLEDPSDFTWVATVTGYDSGQSTTIHGAGRKATSAVLDRVRITTVNGTDTFDAGVVNVRYE